MRRVLLSIIISLLPLQIMASQVCVLKSNWDRIELEYRGDALSSSVEQTPEGEFIRLSLPGEGRCPSIGEPELPAVIRLVQVPFGARVTPEFRVTESETISVDGLIYPRQPSAPKIPGYNPDEHFTVNWDSYYQDSFLLQSPVEIQDIAVARSYRIASIRIQPVNYNPVSGELIVIKRGKLTLRLSDSDIDRTHRIKSRYRSWHFEKIAKSVLLNPDDFEPKWVVPTDIGFYIITPDGYTDEIASYAHWKSRKGYKVVVATTSETGTSASSIKSYIQSRYDSGPIVPDFVLIIGDVGDVTAYNGDVTGEVTDVKYTLLSGGDYLPDIFIGRWSVASSSQLTNLVTRYLDYEQFNYTITTWADKACFIASNDYSYHGVAEGTHQYAIDTYFNPAGFTCDHIKGYYGGSTGDITNAINNGRMIVNYSGHGSDDSWGGPSFSQSNVRALTNQDMYPFVISNACLTGKFSVGECFMETWIRQTNKGAIAALGAADYSYWDQDDEMERRMYDSTFVAGYYFLDGMTQKGLYGVYAEYPGTGNGDAKYYFEEYNLLGDPSTALWFRVPQPLTAAHPENIYLGPNDVDITVTSSGSPVEDALVCITNDDDIHTAAYTNSSGQVTLSIDCTVVDTLYITATAYNKIPYTGEITVTGGDAPHIVYQSYTLDDDRVLPSNGDGEGDASIGEIIEMALTLENSGTEDAASVEATIRTSDPYVIIRDSVKSFGNIPAGATRTSIENYLFEVLSDIPDEHIANFTIIATDAEDSSWASTFDITLHSPLISAVNYTVNDETDHDGFIEPGEDATINVNLLNSGSKTAYTVQATLISLSPHLVITTGTAFYGDIGSSEQKSALSNYEIHIAGDCPSPSTLPVQVNISANWGYTNTDTVYITVGTFGLSDEFEGTGASWSTSGMWNLTTHRSLSGTHSYYCGIDYYFYYRDTTTNLLESPVFIIPANGVVELWYLSETESGYDSCAVLLYHDGSWHSLGILNFIERNWSKAAFDISSFPAGDEATLGLYFKSDNYVHGEGIYIDDIYIGAPRDVTIEGGYVHPIAGGTEDDYTFSALYTSNVLPDSAFVFISGAKYPLSTTDTDPTDGAVFSYTTTLRMGAYNYSFCFFTGGQEYRYPRTTELNEGPFVQEYLVHFDIGASASGFTTAGTLNDWEYGTPTSGPGDVPVGTNCWATNLDGDYRNQSVSELVSPEIDLSSSADPFLIYYHWYCFQPPNSYGYHDGGIVAISVDGGDRFKICPYYGYDVALSRYVTSGEIKRQFAFADDDRGNFWHKEIFDLRPYRGHTVQIYFLFSSSQVNTEPGWYINDMAIYGSIPTGVEEASIPQNLSLLEPFPNPFNANTSIQFNLAKDAIISLDIYNISGQKIETLAKGNFPAGSHDAVWDARNHPTGLYFVILKSGGKSLSRKLILLK